MSKSATAVAASIFPAYPSSIAVARQLDGLLQAIATQIICSSNSRLARPFNRSNSGTSNERSLPESRMMPDGY